MSMCKTIMMKQIKRDTESRKRWKRVKKKKEGKLIIKKTYLAYSSYLLVNLSLLLWPPSFASPFQPDSLPTLSATSLLIPPSSASSLSSVFPTCFFPRSLPLPLSLSPNQSDVLFCLVVSFSFPSILCKCLAFQLSFLS